jgi:hypothetical protein
MVRSRQFHMPKAKHVSVRTSVNWFTSFGRSFSREAAAGAGLVVTVTEGGERLLRAHGRIG